MKKYRSSSIWCQFFAEPSFPARMVLDLTMMVISIETTLRGMLSSLHLGRSRRDHVGHNIIFFGILRPRECSKSVSHAFLSYYPRRQPFAEWQTNTIQPNRLEMVRSYLELLKYGTARSIQSVATSGEPTAHVP